MTDRLPWFARGSIAAALGLGLALAAGIALRFAYPDDIEWKGDERLYFTNALLLAAGSSWPWLGPPTSVIAPSPGMGLWIFAGITAAFGVQTPPELARVVQSLNVAALIAFTAFALLAVPQGRREAWLWAAALWAINPLAVIFERKIWPVSVVPLVMVMLIAAWWFRRNVAAAFTWGLLGALMAQMHAGTAFLAAAIAGWTLLYDRAALPWKSWLAGSAIGALPALPWLIAMLGFASESGPNWRWPIPSFYLRWISQPFGFGIEYTLGPTHMLDYLAGPLWEGRPTYLMAVVHALLIGLVLVALMRTIRAVFRDGWPGIGAFFVGGSSEIILVNATLWGYGGLLTVITMFGAGSHRHYLIAVAPIMALWAVLAVLRGDRPPSRRLGRIILVALCIGQAVLSAGLLGYIHQTQIIRYEYGPTWRSQQPSPLAPAAGP